MRAVLVLALTVVAASCDTCATAVHCDADAECPIATQCNAVGVCVPDAVDGEGAAAEGEGAAGEGEGAAGEGEGAAAGEGEGAAAGEGEGAAGEGEGAAAGEGEGVAGEGEGEGTPPPPSDFVVDSLADRHDAVINGVCDDGTGFCTLRAAIEEAAQRTSTSIALPHGTIALSLGELVIARSVTLRGDPASPTVVDGGGAARVFHVNDPADVFITGVTIQNGHAENQNGGGMLSSTTHTVQLVDVHFVGNSAHNNNALGAAAFITGASDVSIIGTSFDANHLEGSHSGILGLNAVAHFALDHVLFDGNVSDQRGAALYLDNGSTGTVDGSLFTNNTAGERGAIVDLGATEGVVTFTNCTFDGNTGDNEDDIFSAESHWDAHFTFCTFARNDGNITNAGGDTVTFTSCLFDSADTLHCGGLHESPGGNIFNANHVLCGLTASTDQKATFTLDPLANLGGPLFTIAPPSAALAAGGTVACPAVDARGAPRPNPVGTACDSGAVEEP